MNVFWRIVAALTTATQAWWKRVLLAQGGFKLLWGSLPLVGICLCCGLAQSTGQRAGLIAIAPTRTPGPTRTLRPTELPAATRAPEPTRAPEATPTIQRGNPADLLPTPQAGTLIVTPDPVDLVGVVASTANVRDRPSAEGSNVLGQVQAGEQVTLTMQNGERTWYGVESPSGLTGWVSGTLLTVDPAVASQVPYGTSADLGVEVPLDAPAPAPAVEPTVAPPAVAPSGSVVIVNVDKRAETVTLRNDGTAPVDLTQWTLLSVTGRQYHPIGGVLAAGDTRIFPGPEGNIWNNSESDPAELRDAAGNLIDTYP